jgi:DNA (cytosine-5)-methyltransferase 1
MNEAILDLLGGRAGEPMTFGSLFAGIGGFDLGFERAGMVCKWQVEIDPYCQKVLAKHWPNVRKHDDVRTWPKPDTEWVDVICGGFPCQPTSQAGKKQGDKDPRWLWPEFRRIVEQCTPKIVAIENVSRLRRAGLAGILRDLAALGFDARWESLPASAFGAPFEGDRVFICAAHRERCEDTGWLDVWPQPEPGAWWLSEPAVGRVADGVSGTVGGGGGNVEVVALANAVVPQVAEWIGRRIVEAAGCRDVVRCSDE